MTRPGTLDRRDERTPVVVVTCSAYEDAARAQQRLVEGGVPADAVAIDGLRLRPAEEVERARPHQASAAAVGGALTGAVSGYLFGVFEWFDSLGVVVTLALSGLLLGGLLGAAAGVVLALAPSQASHPPGLLADTYTVIVEPGFGAQAAAVLAQRLVSTR